jgi:hypothetical protein
MTQREGSLEAPTRHPLDWRSDEFYDEKALFEELERVFDICHGCRRCFNLCNSFPTLFDLIDESDTMEMDGVAKDDYWQVVDHPDAARQGGPFQKEGRLDTRQDS